MSYCERELTQDERHLAGILRETIADNFERLHAAQSVCHVAENLRDLANSTVANVPVIREDVWNSLHFPRYRFFDAAMPNQGWAQFAESR
jgi:hypothetical protein